MKLAIGNSTAIPVATAPPHAYDAAPTHCFLCSYDAIYDYDVSGCIHSRTSSTSVATTFDGDAGFVGNCGLFEGTAGGHEWDTADFGVSLYGYRHYKPDVGRWVNRDPLGDHASDAARQLHGQLAFVMAVTSAQWLHVAVDEYNDPIYRINAIYEAAYWTEGIRVLQSGDPSFNLRWYDPITGMWLSNDPIGISGGLNQYVAFNNNPVLFVDSDGRIAIGEIAYVAYRVGVPAAIGYVYGDGWKGAVSGGAGGVVSLLTGAGPGSGAAGGATSFIVSTLLHGTFDVKSGYWRAGLGLSSGTGALGGFIGIDPVTTGIAASFGQTPRHGSCPRRKGAAADRVGTTGVAVRRRVRRGFAVLTN